LGSGIITKEKILQAALEVFTHTGYEGARMEKIASMVGINKASLYFHFKSKEDIFRELFHDILDKYLSLIKSITEGTKGLESRKRLTLIYQQYLDYNIDNLEMAFWNRIYYAAPEVMRDEIITATDISRTVFVKALTEVMEEGIGRKELKPMDPGNMAMTYYYLITCIDLSTDMMSKEIALKEMEQCFDVLWKGIRSEKQG
jgi:AcrR family transcriptional regulator